MTEIIKILFEFSENKNRVCGRGEKRDAGDSIICADAGEAVHPRSWGYFGCKRIYASVSAPEDPSPSGGYETGGQGNDGTDD